MRRCCKLVRHNAPLRRRTDSARPGLSVAWYRKITVFRPMRDAGNGSGRVYTLSVERRGIMRVARSRRNRGADAALARSINSAGFGYGCDAAARAQLGAVQRGHGVGELERVAHRHPLEHSITKRPVKHVSGAGGIHAIHHETRGSKRICHPRAPALRASPASWPRLSSGIRPESSPERTERIALIGPLAGKFGARDQIIDRSEHPIEPVVNRIDIHADGNPMARASRAAFSTAGVSCPSMWSIRAPAIFSAVMLSGSRRRHSGRLQNTVRSPVD